MAMNVSGPPWVVDIPPAVPGAGILEVADFAALLALPSPVAGQRARTAAPVVTGGVPYIRWVYDGSMFRLDGPQVLLEDRSISVGIASATEQLLKQTLIPGRLLLMLRRSTFVHNFGRSGTVDAMTVRARMGSSGTLSDAVITSDAGLNALNTRGVQHIGFAATETAWQAYHNRSFGWGVGANSGFPVGAQTTLPAMTAAIYYSVTVQPSGATDTPSVINLVFEGV